MKIPIIRKGEYDIWSMRMRQYICHIDHNLWDVIVNGDLEEEPAPKNREKLLLSLSSGSNSASQNLAFLSSENTGSINEVSTASGDFGMDGDDLEELDLRWQVAMLTVRSKIECYNCHRKGHFARECRSGRSQGRRSYGDNGRSNAPTTESSSQALVAQDGLGGYDWSNDFEVETRNFLTPRADISFAGLDEYAIRNKIIELQTTELNNKIGDTAGKTNDANSEKPKSVSGSVVSNPKINRDSVIIEDWTSDDEEEVSKVQKVRLENQTVKSRDDKSGQNSHKQGVGFRKVKACFVCRST
ncbi:retrovirus-related pol polyprotein from transposon TNT 1-94 [Tanacetum coccineum]